MKTYSSFDEYWKPIARVNYSPSEYILCENAAARAWEAATASARCPHVRGGERGDLDEGSQWCELAESSSAKYEAALKVVEATREYFLHDCKENEIDLKESLQNYLLLTSNKK